MIDGRCPSAELSALRAGDEVAGVYACTRKDRLTARTGSPYLALELRDRTSALPARVFRDADLLGGRFERGDLVRVQGRVERFRDELQVDVRAIERAEAADPASFLPGRLPRPRRARRLPRAPRAGGPRPRLPGAAGDAAPRGTPARRVAARTLHAQRPPRLPRRAARAHGGGRHARARGLPAAPAPPDVLRHGRARARPGQDARVHVRRGDRGLRRGPPARASRARPAAAGAAPGGARTGAPASRCCTACSATTGRTPRPAGASGRRRRWRCTASTHSTRPSRARSSTD